MGTTADKLEYLQGTKAAIREAIVAKGVDVPADTPFRAYATKIGEISGGGEELVNVQLVAQYGYTNVDEGDPNAFWVYAQTEPGVYEVLRFNLGEVQNIQVVKNSTILGSVTYSFPSQVSGNAQILYDAKLQSMPGYNSYPILVYGDCGIVF